MSVPGREPVRVQYITVSAKLQPPSTRSEYPLLGIGIFLACLPLCATTYLLFQFLCTG